MQSRSDLITMSSTKSFVLNLISQLESMSKSQHDEQLSEVSCVTCISKWRMYCAF